MVSSSDEDEEEESDDEEERKKRKGEKKRTTKGKGLAEIQLESLARARLVEAAPKMENEKYGENSRVDYHALKNRFISLGRF